MLFFKRKARFLGANLLLLIIITVMSAGIHSDEVIHFSRESGFYEDSFYLEIKERKGCTFYYTLDGSRPDMMSQKYTEPILMADASEKGNIYSVRKDVSPLLEDDALQKDGQGTRYISPENPVDKCNVIRVAAYDREGRVVAEAAEVYFIGFQEKSGYAGIGKISLVTEPENLFDYESGIYVTGKKQDEYQKKEQQPFERWDANYRERGREWEKAALIDVFDQNGDKLFSSACGIRIHGGVTRAIPQKSFNVYARTEYGGGRRFTFDLFTNGNGPHKFILSSGGNDDAVKVKDYVVQKVAAEAGMDMATMKMFPCVLFLNGEYWGVYYVTESYDASYIADHYGVSENNVVIAKQTMQGVEIEDGNAEDIELYYEMADYISSHDMRDNDAYQKACEMIDIDSFVDYYAMQIYIGNYDWPGNNVALWRARDEYAFNVWADGRWRYMLFDINNPSVFGAPERDDLERTIAEDTVFASLIQNEEVAQKFRKRIIQLENEVFCWENREEIFNQWYNEMNESVKKNNERFYNMAEIETTEHYINSMKWFLENRPDYMHKYMSDCFGEVN